MRKEKTSQAALMNKPSVVVQKFAFRVQRFCQANF
ncbi:hypothetical protein J2S34_000823 [Nitrobacter winogradskyi]|uniref:Uncharacterized protein n=1 Tax=Nitrobacter winogradskyi TaxID=913 RepID=A0ACC6AGJ2_NITWI|nr:hypothetical protein [Nitrobacter winogradskyi]